MRAHLCLTMALCCSTLLGCDVQRAFRDGLAEPGDLAVTVFHPDLLNAACGPCAAPTAVCDAKIKRCVECLADVDCPDGALCRSTHCVSGCNAGHPGCGDAGACDVDSGTCHGCRGDKECGDPQKPFCDVATGLCGACNPMADRCPPGQVCQMVNGALSCAPGCRADIECQTRDGGSVSWACCNHACVDTALSLANCGGCAVACNQNACCGGKCGDSQSDVANCGGCGITCPAKNNIPLCAAGKCTSAGCLKGYADCNKDMSDGCEITIDGNLKNCGACGNVCMFPNASPLCLVGKCTIGLCNPGFRDCNATIADGCEVDVTTDVLNCGLCANSCNALPHAMAGCKNSVCGILSCSPGFIDCNMNSMDGCEADTANDVANCGGCAKACPMPANVVMTCAMGTCRNGGCALGYADCNMNMADGCEARLAVDPMNCGACNMACAAPANASAACNSGMCQPWTCNAGFADCDNNAGNGCEVNTKTDKSNCGGCGKVCPGMCVNSMCVVGPACSNGSFTDCNPVNATLIAQSAFVDPTPPMGWVQCAGFVNSVGDDVANNAMNNCLGGQTRLRLRIFDAQNKLVVDVYHSNLNALNAWPVAAAYLDGCNCKGALTLAVCGPLWPCQNTSTFYVSSNGTGGGGCGGYNAGGPTLSNGNAAQVTVAPTMIDGKELWMGMCYGNTQYVGYKVAVYK